MSIKLNKIMRDFNVGLSTIVEFLRKKGITVEENPNTKINDEEYELLIREFSNDKNIKIGSVEIGKKQQPKKEEESMVMDDSKPKIVTEETRVKIDAPAIESIVEIVGHIDLDTINQTTCRPKEGKDAVVAKIDNKGRNRINGRKINISKEKDPMFIGDIPSFKKWINSQYSDALDPYITEDVVVIDVYFNVDEKGRVKDVRAQNAKYPLLAEEAVRIVSLSPAWIPGTKYGIPTKMPQLFYLKFNRLDDEEEEDENETDTRPINSTQNILD